MRKRASDPCMFYWAYGEGKLIVAMCVNDGYKGRNADFKDKNLINDHPS